MLIMTLKELNYEYNTIVNVLVNKFDIIKEDTGYYISIF